MRFHARHDPDESHFFVDDIEVSSEEYESAMKAHDYSGMLGEGKRTVPATKCCLHPDEKSFHKGGE